MEDKKVFLSIQVLYAIISIIRNKFYQNNINFKIQLKYKILIIKTQKKKIKIQKIKK